MIEVNVDSPGDPKDMTATEVAAVCFLKQDRNAKMRKMLERKMLERKMLERKMREAE